MHNLLLDAHAAVAATDRDDHESELSSEAAASIAAIPGGP
jgi:hypothetical protein